MSKHTTEVTAVAHDGRVDGIDKFTVITALGAFSGRGDVPKIGDWLMVIESPTFPPRFLVTAEGDTLHFSRDQPVRA